LPNIDELYEKLVDYFGEYGSGNPRVLLDRNIVSLMAKKDKTEEEAIVELYEKYENKITKLYEKNEDLLKEAKIRAEKRKRKREQPKRELREAETEETLPDLGEVTPSVRTAPRSPIVLFFYIMGAIIVLLSLGFLLSIRWDLLQPPASWLYLLVWFVSFSVGLTEIAVGWLVDKQFLRTS
jgi:ribosomal protein S17E